MSELSQKAVQACRGHSEEQEVALNADHDRLDTHLSADCVPDSSHVAEKSDFYLAYATPSGFIAWRDPTKGSYYITELCRSIASHATYSDIINQANKGLSSQVHTFENSKNAIQTIEVIARLKGSIYFL